MTSDPDFKVTTFFEVDISEKLIKDLKTKLLHKRKVYITWNGRLLPYVW